MQTSQEIKPVATSYKKESILVVKKDLFFDESTTENIIAIDLDEAFKKINSFAEFRDRAEMEVDENYKQIIPYLIYKYQDQLFVMQRKETASEQRLKNKLSLGIGGHVRKEDLSESTTILDWAAREFEEEVSFKGSYNPKFIGLLNDDSNSVGRVHLGLVFVLEGNSTEIAIKSEHKQGALLPISKIKEMQEEFESWSKICLQAL